MMNKSFPKFIGLIVVVVTLVLSASQSAEGGSQGPQGLTDKSKTGVSFWDGKYSCSDNGYCQTKKDPSCIVSLHADYLPF